MPASAPRRPVESLANPKDALRKRKGGDPLPIQSKAPDPPPWLPPALVPEFRRRADDLARLKHTDERDADALAILVTAAADVESADHAIAEDGAYVTSPKGFLMRHPAVTDREKALQRMAQAIRILGVSPTNRGQVHAPPKEEKADPKRDRLTQLRERARGGA
jgi:P27 family predicted phage terminase small subunit